MASVESEVFAVRGRVRSRVCVALTVALVGALVVGGPSAADGPGSTKRLSVNSAGAQGDSSSSGPAVSTDGRYVTFSSDASNLVAGDTNSTTDVFVHDTATGTTRRVSVDSAGTQANDSSHGQAVSADGRYVVFNSSASNLVAGDTNGKDDVFVHDTATGTTRRVSVDSAGTQADFGSQPGVSVSADGRYVAFSSFASNLVAGGDTNGTNDVFVHDTATVATRRVSVDSAGAQANDFSFDPAVSADGRYVFFTSGASNLVAGDTNGYTSDVFVHDTATGTTRRVSVDSAGTQADHRSDDPAISADGRYVAFSSWASNLVAGDSNGTTDVFVHDTATGTTRRVSIDSAGTQANNNDSSGPAVSADGRYVAFSSDASNLVAGDTNNEDDVFVHDTSTGTTRRASVGSAGTQGNDESSGPAVSADGRYVFFSSSASNLVAGDTNNAGDVFVHQRDTTAPSNVRITTALSAFVKARSVDLAWSGSDPSGPPTYDVRVRRAPYNDGFGSWSLFRHDTTSIRATLARQTGHTYCFSARARDTAGNQSPWSSSKCTAVPLNDTQLTHTGPWTQKYGTDYYLNTYSQTRTKGAKLSKFVQADRLAVLVTKGPGFGTVGVYLAGDLLKKINLGASTLKKKQLIQVADFATLRSGTLTIKVLTDDKVVRIEGAGVSRD